jgi:hypothetical protein
MCVPSYRWWLSEALGHPEMYAVSADEEPVTMLPRVPIPSGRALVLVPGEAQRISRSARFRQRFEESTCN